MSFRIVAQPQQSEARWAIRLWKHEYYEFRYIFPDPDSHKLEKGHLQAFFVASGRTDELPSERSYAYPDDPGKLYDCFYPGDRLLVTLTGQGSRFGVTTKLIEEEGYNLPHPCGTDKDSLDTLNNAKIPQKMMLFDENKSRRPYGGVAFLGGGNGEVKVVFVSLSGSGKRTQ